jgi:hypothetical protein
MAKTMNDEDLGSLLDRIISKAEDFSSSKLQKEREAVLNYYRGEAPAPLHAGDSKYVSRDVYDAVDSARSNLIETYSAHQRIVFFRPEKDETVAQAKQASEYCRHVFFKQNHGEDLMYAAISDGLMNRFSVAKVYYKEIKDEIEHEFSGLTEDELDMFVADMYDFEFTETDTSALAQGLYSGTIAEVKLKRKICVEIIQPEDIKILGRATSLQDAKAVIHTQEMTRSQLLKEGVDKKKVNKLTFETKNDTTLDYEKQLRHEPIGQTLGSDDGVQEATETIVVHEVYADIDMDKSGTAKLYRVLYAGGEILDKERVRIKPFAAFVPIPVPHTFFGENYAKSVIPIQNARTIMLRQIINHTVRSNNDRMMVLNGTLHNPKELLDNRMGGIVNVKRMDGLSPLPQTMMNPFVFDTVRLLDEDKEEVTGISKLAQGLNKDAISTQNAEGKIDQLIQLSQQRQKTIARRFGLFMRELYFLIYHAAVDYIEESDYVSVTGQYVEVNPTEWKERTAASIELSLSQYEREAESQKFLELDVMFTQHPALGQQYTPEKRWEVLSQMAEKRGIEDLETYLLKPEQVQPSEPSEMEKLQMDQLRAQVKLVNAQADSMIMKAQTEAKRVSIDEMKAKTDMAAKADKQDLDEKKFDHDVEIDWAEVDNAKASEEQTGIWSPNS